MKVIHILKGKANPETMNGVNKVVHQLATEQLSQGIDVEVWGLTDTPDIIKHEHVYPLKLFRIPKNRFAISRQFKDEISKIGNKVVAHLHSVFLPELYAVSKSLKKHNIEYVLTPHSGYNKHSFKKNYYVKKIYYALFERSVVQGSKRLHAIGESEVDDLRQIARNKEIILIPNGYPVTTEENIQTRNKKQSNQPIYCFCGRLATEHKGLDLLIDGFSLYKENGGKGELWLVGDGPGKDQLIEKVNIKNLSNYVIFHGAKFGEEKINIIKKADLFLHTSRWDVVPTACIEAAALGLPLLVSKETNMGQFVTKHNAGFVLERNSADNIASSLKNYEESFSTLCFTPLKMVEQEFDWRKLAKKFSTQLYCTDVE